MKSNEKRQKKEAKNAKKKKSIQSAVAISCPSPHRQFS